MSVFSVRDRRMLREMLGNLTRPVSIVAYADPSDRAHLEELTEELVGLSRGLLSVRLMATEQDGALVSALGFRASPSFAFVLPNGEFAPVEMVGFPTGYQFGAFLNLLLTLNRGRPRLSHAVHGALKNITQDVRLEVIVTATCPNCPGVVGLAQQCALANPARIQAISLDAVQHPQFVGPGVEAVPLTRVWVQGRLARQATGLMSEQQFYRLIQSAVKGGSVRDRVVEEHF